MVRTSTTAGGGYAAFGDVGEIPLGERRAGLIDRRVLESFMGAVGSVRAVRMSGGTRPNFISSIDQPLSIPMLDPRMMFRPQFRLLVVVCLFGLLEDIHQVLTSTDDLPRLVDDRDCLHERHLGGNVLIRRRRPASMGI
jgi:hypothetical protein